MIYYYDVLIEYKKAKTSFIKQYFLSFIDLPYFFEHLNKNHKDNYTVFSIKEHRRYYDKKR